MKIKFPLIPEFNEYGSAILIIGDKRKKQKVCISVIGGDGFVIGHLKGHAELEQFALNILKALNKHK